MTFQAKPGSCVTPFEKKLAAGKRRRALRERAVAYLGGSCRICKYEGCVSAFDFHHVNALEKDFTISSRMTSWAAIEHELKKCVLLCARCHREVHEGLHAGYLEDDSTMRGGGWDDLDEDDLLDPDVTPEQLRAEMERPTPFDAPGPTMRDLLAPVG